MIDEDVKEGIKETIVSWLYKHQRGDSDSGSDIINEELNDRLLAIEEIEEFRDYAILVKITLALEYPGVVPIPDSLPEYFAKLVGAGLSDAEIKKNVVRFYLWDAFCRLKKSPESRLYQCYAHRRVMQSKKHDIPVDPDDLVFLLGAMGEPAITEKQKQQLIANKSPQHPVSIQTLHQSCASLKYTCQTPFCSEQSLVFVIQNRQVRLIH
jgi:hypothetical protein